MEIKFSFKNYRSLSSEGVRLFTINMPSKTKSRVLLLTMMLAGLATNSSVNAGTTSMIQSPIAPTTTKSTLKHAIKRVTAGNFSDRTITAYTKYATIAERPIVTKNNAQSRVICPKCGAFPDHGRISCCAPGGAWYRNCGTEDSSMEHSFKEGIEACKPPKTSTVPNGCLRTCDVGFGIQNCDQATKSAGESCALLEMQGCDCHGCQCLETTTSSSLPQTSLRNTNEMASDGQQDIVIIPGNVSWRPTCERILQVDDKCMEHKSKIFWTEEQQMAIKVVFIIFGCIAIIVNVITVIIGVYINMSFGAGFFSTFHIAIFLCICDILRPISSFAALNIDHHSEDFGSSLRCQLSAMFFQFFSIGALGWIILFSIYLYFNMKSAYTWREHRVKTITGFHIFACGIAALFVLLPALLHKPFGIAAEGDWCWIRGDELVSRIAFHDLFLLLATAAFIVSCILTARMDSDYFRKITVVYAVPMVFQLFVAVMDVTLRAINPCCPIFAVTITMAFASSLRAAFNPILLFIILLKWADDNFDDD